MKSMTGYAKVRHEGPEAVVEAEVRSLNSRHLKVTTTLTGIPLSMEEEVVSRTRRHAHRGAIHLTLSYTPTGREASFRLNRKALGALLTDAEEASRGLGREIRVDLGSLLVHPWLLEPSDIPRELLERDWPSILRTIDDAMLELVSMREKEGESLGQELLLRGQAIRTSVEEIRRRVPAHLEEWRGRLRQRLEALAMSERIPIAEADLAREFVFYAERSDVTEELDRIASHLSQYFQLLEFSGEIGRKLEFLVQELAREANTIGSKTTDDVAGRIVIGIKTDLEKIREQIQNIE